jgi:rhomboid protease GluP
MKIKFKNPFRLFNDNSSLNKSEKNKTPKYEVYEEKEDIFGRKVRVLKNQTFDEQTSVAKQNPPSPASLLISINLFLYILPSLVGYPFNLLISNQEFLALGWKDTSLIFSGQVWRLLTSTFLHADIFHILLNMFALWQIAPIVLHFLSQKQFWLVYFGSGVGGSLASVFFSPSTNSVGASGAIFGLIGSLISISIKIKNRQLFNNLLLIVFINVVYALNPVARIDNWGHLGGLLVGFLITQTLQTKAFNHQIKFA